MEYALHVLNLPHTYTWEQLRINYKRIALQLHPDKCSLDATQANQLFHVLTESYKVLKAALNHSTDQRDPDADWMTLRGRAHVFTSQEQSRQLDKHAGSVGTDGSFDVDKFNARFSETRLGDENDRGYSDWMRRLSPEAAAERQITHRVEERRRAAEDRHTAIVSSVPEAMPSRTTLPHSELGVARVKDFGRHVADVIGGKRGVLNYTDYKVAHMTAPCLIDPETVRARREFHSLEEYELARSDAASLTLTPQEKAQLERFDAQVAAREQRRLVAVRSRDDLVARHHAINHPLAIA